MSFPKVLILHDYFLYRGGGERLIISLAKGLKADIATAFIAKDAFDPREHGIKTTELLTESWFSRLPGFRYLQVQASFLFATKKIVKNYDVIIYSGDCLTALLNARGKTNIAYLHTPPRHLYDHYQETLARYNLFKKMIFVPFVWFNRWRFETLARRFDEIVTNSKNTQERIKNYLKLPSIIAYPPCDTLPFKNLGQENFFLSWARLYPIKRVDMIVEAFQKMPDKKLVVASGGPEESRLRALAKGHSNITILGWVSDADLLKYLGKCLATIYIPVREDFGMSPVESMTAGKPVLGVAEGGMLEVIEHDINGWLLKPNFTVDDIVRAVQAITPEECRLKEAACYATAHTFTEAAFLKTMREIIETTYARVHSAPK
jgi:glycosyltransferase involved in cell wall biosynthesis